MVTAEKSVPPYLRGFLTTIHHYDADWRPAPVLALLQILNSLLEITDVLLRVPFNLF